MGRRTPVILNSFFIVFDLLFHFVDRCRDGDQDIFRLRVRDKIVLVFRIQQNFRFLFLSPEVQSHIDLQNALEIMQELLRFFPNLELGRIFEMPMSDGYFDLHSAQSFLGTTGPFIIVNCTRPNRVYQRTL
jgi:hypothetical protein